MSKQSKKATNEALMYLAVIAAVVVLSLSALSFWAHKYINDMVTSELSAQKIYFPEKGSPALDPAKYPDLQKYAGQLVDTPEEAKAYANGYIGQHLKDAAGGKTYSEISTEARQDPNNEELQAKKQTLFQGETLRAALLSNGYGFGTMGKIAGIFAYVLAASGAVLLVTAAIIRARL
jgi:hypothetical protein